MPEGALGDAAVGKVVEDRRREELQQDAFQLGRRIYLDKPNELTNRIKGYWKAWHAEAAVRV